VGFTFQAFMQAETESVGRFNHRRSTHRGAYAEAWNAISQAWAAWEWDGCLGDHSTLYLYSRRR
jgi:hypothetical protein